MTDTIKRIRVLPDGTWRMAVYSPCEAYRYFLGIRWDFSDEGRAIVFLMLNPSTATELENDPTVAGCEKRARAWGYAGCNVLNIFAYRATDPAEMKRQADPVGPENDATIFSFCRNHGMVVCAWGNHGSHLDRSRDVRKILRDANAKPHYLQMNGSGLPKHPLYVRHDLKPVPWE